MFSVLVLNIQHMLSLAFKLLLFNCSNEIRLTKHSSLAVGHVLLGQFTISQAIL